MRLKRVKGRVNGGVSMNMIMNMKMIMRTKKRIDLHEPVNNSVNNSVEYASRPLQLALDREKESIPMTSTYFICQLHDLTDPTPRIGSFQPSIKAGVEALSRFSRKVTITAGRVQHLRIEVRFSWC